MNKYTTASVSPVANDIEQHEAAIKRLKKQRKAERKRAKARKAEQKARAERRQLAIDTYTAVAKGKVSPGLAGHAMQAAAALLALDA